MLSFLFRRILMAVLLTFIKQRSMSFSLRLARVRLLTNSLNISVYGRAVSSPDPIQYLTCCCFKWFKCQLVLLQGGEFYHNMSPFSMEILWCHTAKNGDCDLKMKILWMSYRMGNLLDYFIKFKILHPILITCSQICLISFLCKSMCLSAHSD